MLSVISSSLFARHLIMPQPRLEDPRARNRGWGRDPRAPPDTHPDIGTEPEVRGPPPSRSDRADVARGSAGFEVGEPVAGLRHRHGLDAEQPREARRGAGPRGAVPRLGHAADPSAGGDGG